jgi:hypothetical protein
MLSFFKIYFVFILFSAVFLNNALGKGVSVAMSPFSATDNSYVSSQNAAGFSEVLQVELMAKASLEWVEREQINQVIKEHNLSVLGMIGNESVVQLGSLLKADLLIRGQFYKVPKKSWALHVEIIDLYHADVLEVVDIPISSDSSGSLSELNRELPKVGKSVVQVLAKAYKALKKSDATCYVAPMFFCNEEPGGRLDFYKHDFMAACEKYKTVKKNIRIIQFPRADQAVNEAELVVSGLIKDDLNRWQKLADYYVWAYYKEVDSDGLPFDKVNVQVRVTMWDGFSSPIRKSWKMPVSRLEVMSKEIIKYVLTHAVKKNRTITVSDLRNKMAEELYEQADDIQYLILQEEHTETELSDTWCQRWRDALRILSVASFFAPDNEKIRTALLVEKTRNGLDRSAKCCKNRFKRRWARANAWKQHCDRFGFGYIGGGAVPNRGSVGSRGDNRLDTGFNTSPLAYVTSVSQLLDDVYYTREGHGINTDIPKDVPPEILESWYENLCSEFSRRLLHVEKRCPEKIPVLRVGDYLFQIFKHTLPADLKMKLVELLWDKAIQNRTVQGRRDSVSKSIQTICSNVGKPERAAELITMIPEYKKPNSNKVQNKKKVKKAKKGVRKKVFAELIKPKISVIPVNKYCYSQDFICMDVIKDTLWFGVNGQQLLMKHITDTLMWDIDKREMRSVHKMYGPHSNLTSIKKIGDQIWLTFDSTGVWMIKNGKARKFTARDGLPSHEIYDSCVWRKKMFFGGGNERKGVLCSYDFNKGKWAKYKLPSLENGAPLTRIEHIAAGEKYMIIYSNCWGCETRVHVADMATMQW